MSTQLVDAAVLAPAPSLSAGVCGLLQALARGANADDSILVGRGGGNVVGLAAAKNVPVRELSPTWIPPMLLRVLEEGAGLPWRVSLSAVHGRAGLDPVTLSALTCSFTVARVCINPLRPDSPYGKRWTWPEDRLAEILAGLEAFAAPPTIVVCALPDLVALWSLDQPVRVVEQAEQDRAMSLLRTLAARLKGDVQAEDVRLSDLSVPLPGTAPVNPAAEWEPVSVTAFHSTRIYSLSEIEAALAAKGK